MPMKGSYDLVHVVIKRELKTDVSCDDPHKAVDIDKDLQVPLIPIGDGLFLGQKLIAIEKRNGIMVYEGIHRGRKASIKRFVKGFHDFAEREHRMLLATKDQYHSNIIRLYGQKEDDNFIYLALEPCDCNLYDFVKDYKHSELWYSSTGFPSPKLLKLIRGIVAGLAHLHSLGFVHTDLKPSNVLMVGLCPKLSGRCIRLDEDHESSLRLNDIAADKIALGMDMFSLASVIHFCLCEGQRLRRKPKEFTNEACDLFSKFSIEELDRRPKTSDVLIHPMFWNPKTRMSFLKDVIDQTKETKHAIFLNKMLNGRRCFVFPETGWDSEIRDDFLDQMERKTSYDYTMVTGLLYFVRETMNSYHTLSESVQEMLGAMPEGIDLFFRTRFPALLMEVYDVMYHHCKQEKWFEKYRDVVFLYGEDV